MHGAGDIVLGTKLVDGLDVLSLELEVEAVEVALDAAGRQALGQDNVAAGGVPVQENLSRGLAVLLGDGADGRVLELVATGQRGVGLDLDAVLGAELDESLTLAEGVDLDLVDGGDDLAGGQEGVHVGGAEVGDTDGLDLAQTLGVLESAPRLVTLLVAVTGGVDQVEVEVVKAGLVEGVAESLEGGLVAVVGIPELGADEDLLSGGAGALQPGADGTTASLLVGVTGSRVDVTVAGVEGGGDGILSLLAVGGLVDTQGDLGDHVAIVELDAGDGGGAAAEGVVLGTDGLLDLVEGLTLRRGLGGDSGGSHCEVVVDVCGGGVGG